MSDTINVIATSFIPVATTGGSGGSVAFSDITGKPALVSGSSIPTASLATHALTSITASYALNAGAGVAGPSGSQGPQGVQGPSGSQGPQGIQGPSGSSPTLPTGTVSSSLQAALWSVATASYAMNGGGAASWGTLTGIPTGIMSSSAQVLDALDVEDITGVVSSSAQINALSGVSASYALTASYALNGGGGVTTWSTITGRPDGIVSSSVQAATWTVATASLANGVQWTNVLNKSTGIVSSSTQVYAMLDLTTVDGVVSSSAQINALSGVSASFAATASYVRNAVTASIATNAVTSVSSSYAATASFSPFQTTATITAQNTTGILQSGYLGQMHIPAHVYLNKVQLQSNESGTIAFDLRRTSYAAWAPDINNGTSITGSLSPDMTASVKTSSTSLTGWTRDLVTDDVINFYVKAVSGSATFNNCAITLYLSRV